MTTTAQAAEERGFLAALLADSADDTARLAYADWCEEYGQPERAEFIRVQYELEKWVAADYQTVWNAAIAEVKRGMSRLERNGNQDVIRDKAIPVHRRMVEEQEAALKRLRGRESTLLAAHEAEWRRAGPCPKCERGWWGAPGKRKSMCRDCHGTGDAGGLLQTLLYPTGSRSAATGPSEVRDRIRVEFRRGFPDAVHARFEEVFEPFAVTCPECEGLLGETAEVGVVCRTCGNRGDATEYHPTPRALAWVRHHPISRIVLTDRNDCLRYNTDGFYWRDDGIFDHEPFLPKAIAPKDVYPTREAALDALAVAVCEVVRTHAKETTT